MKPIALIGTLDTKGAEVRYVQGVIESQGCSVLLIDTGTLSSAQDAAITAKDKDDLRFGLENDGFDTAGLFFYNSRIQILLWWSAAGADW